MSIDVVEYNYIVIGAMLMKFCRQCGFQLNDEDRFCPKCGKSSEIISPSNNQINLMNTPVLNNAIGVLDVPQPGVNEAILVVVCNSVYQSGKVIILNGNGKHITINNGEKTAVKVTVGNMVISYRVDRGPCLTLFAARKSDYSKALFFHSGEIILMQVNIGSEINSATFQSSLGFSI